MKVNKKHCDGCESSQFIWKNDKGSKYCKNCWYKAKVPSAKPLNRKKLKPMCEASLPGCTKASTDVHHKKGRGDNHLVVSTWMSVCRQCHTWIEEHPKESIELGHSIKRI